MIVRMKNLQRLYHRDTAGSANLLRHFLLVSLTSLVPLVSPSHSEYLQMSAIRWRFVGENFACVATS